MNIKEFLNLSAGNWFVQRTNYQLNAGEADNSKADITVEFLSSDDAQVIQICEQNNIDASLSLGGTKYSWDTSVDALKPKQKGSSLLILIPNSNEPQTGKLLKQSKNINENNSFGRYILGQDLALTLIVETENIYAEERQWFASDNLKFRTTIVKDSNGNTQTSFYSEIRKAPPLKKE
jgi:hypothetical protein